MLYELGGAKFPKKVDNLIENYLSDRKIRVAKENGTIEAAYSRRCPQGSNFGSVLWNVIFNTALRLNLGDDIYLQAYTDFFLLVVSDVGIQKLKRTTDEALRRLVEWSRKKLQFSADKTQRCSSQKAI